MEHKRYAAFISYRHTSTDAQAAGRLHAFIESYQVPHAIYKASGIKKMGRVFRDQEELPLSSDLGGDIENALRDSEWLIVVCSPQLLESKWCMREVDYFISLGRRDHILTVLVSGEPKDSFPPQLRYINLGEELVDVEPLAADIRADTLRAMLKKLKREKLRLLAPMLGVGYDDLKRRARERRLKITAALCLAAFIAVSIFSLYAVRQNSLIAAQRNIALQNQSMYIVKEAKEAYKNRNLLLAKQLALSALPDNLQSPNKPVDKEAIVLLRGLMMSYRYKYYAPEYVIENIELPAIDETVYSYNRLMSVLNGTYIPGKVLENYAGSGLREPNDFYLERNIIGEDIRYYLCDESSSRKRLLEMPILLSDQYQQPDCLSDDGTIYAVAGWLDAATKDAGGSLNAVYVFDTKDLSRIALLSVDMGMNNKEYVISQDNRYLTVSAMESGSQLFKIFDLSTEKAVEDAAFAVQAKDFRLHLLSGGKEMLSVATSDDSLTFLRYSFEEDAWQTPMTASAGAGSRQYALSPDERYYAVLTNREDGSLYLVMVDLHSGKTVFSGEMDTLKGSLGDFFFFTQDSSRLVFIAEKEDYSSQCLLSIPVDNLLGGGSIERTHWIFLSGYDKVLLSSDGELMVTYKGDTLRLYSTSILKLLDTITVPVGVINTAYIAPDDEHVAVICRDGDICSMQVISKTASNEPEALGDTFVMSNDGSKLAIMSFSDGGARMEIYDTVNMEIINSGTVTPETLGLTGSDLSSDLEFVDISNDGATIVLATPWVFSNCDNAIYFINTANFNMNGSSMPTLHLVSKDGKDFISAISTYSYDSLGFSKDGSQFYLYGDYKPAEVVSRYPTLFAFDVTTGGLIAQRQYEDSVDDFYFRAGSAVYAIVQNKQAVFYDLATGEINCSMAGNNVVLSPDGSRAVIDRSKTQSIWAYIRDREGNYYDAYGSVESYGSTDMVVVDTVTGENVCKIDLPQDEILKYPAFVDKSQVLLLYGDAALYKYNAVTGELIDTVITSEKGSNYRSMETMQRSDYILSGDGTRFAFTYNDDENVVKFIEIWNLEDMTRIVSFATDQSASANTQKSIAFVKGNAALFLYSEESGWPSTPYRVDIPGDNEVITWSKETLTRELTDYEREKYYITK